MFHDHSDGNPFARPVNRLLALLVVVFLLLVCFTGCASNGLFENRVHCTMDGNRAVVVSKWGGFGIASELTNDDARAICKGEGVKL